MSRRAHKNTRQIVVDNEYREEELTARHGTNPRQDFNSSSKSTFHAPFPCILGSRSHAKDGYFALATASSYVGASSYRGGASSKVPFASRTARGDIIDAAIGILVAFSNSISCVLKRGVTTGFKPPVIRALNAGDPSPRVRRGLYFLREQTQQSQIVALRLAKTIPITIPTTAPVLSLLASVRSELEGVDVLV
jgi:hypothetical protein